MNTNALSLVACAHFLFATNLAHAACSPALDPEFNSALRVVDSLRADKPGQARVTAADGSEFTATQSLWMKGRLRLARRACEQGDEPSASASLRAIADLLSAHHRA